MTNCRNPNLGFIKKKARAEMNWNNVLYECPKQTLTERGIVHPRLHTFNGDGSCDNNNHTLCMPLKCKMLVFDEFQLHPIQSNIGKQNVSYPTNTGIFYHIKNMPFICHSCKTKKKQTSNVS